MTSGGPFHYAIWHNPQISNVVELIFGALLNILINFFESINFLIIDSFDRVSSEENGNIRINVLEAS